VRTNPPATLAHMGIWRSITIIFGGSHHHHIGIAKCHSYLELDIAKCDGDDMKSVSYSRSAQKTLQKIPRNVAQLIIAKINQYARDASDLANNVKKLKGDFEGLIRLRVGDWRIIMDDRGNVLMILEIKPRGGAYE
jgi:mRNA interferase RelE/StbE